MVTDWTTKRFGLALGGGGARGLAHVVAIETLERYGLKAEVVAGTSMGAIVGALYASGQSGAQVREGIESHIVTKGDRFKDIVAKRSNLVKWLTAVQPELGRGGILRADGLLHYLLDQIQAQTFDDLERPFFVVATDFWTGEEVVINSGELMPAIKASMAIPGIFAPVVIENRVLVDGGMSNNVPYDILLDRCDATVAIDIAPERASPSSEVPNILDSVIGMFDMLIEKVMHEKFQQAPATLYFNPGVTGVRVLDFDKIENVFQQTQEAMPKLEAELERLGFSADAKPSRSR